MREQVRELHNHDFAFTILIESYQQIQTSRIEADYQERLFAADQVSDTSVREHVRQLAQQERAGRLAQLAYRLERMKEGYDTSRREQEKTIGVRVANRADTVGAVKQIGDMAVAVTHPTQSALSRR